MKIAISYPPLESGKGLPFLSQNRQFQWTNTNNVIYPVVPAYAATLLHNQGHDVLWDDAVAQGLSHRKWLTRLKRFEPDLVLLETKTPVIKHHWKLIDDLKNNIDPKIVLCGDHVTAFPLESFENSKVDFILIGGDYDFLLSNLISHLASRQKLAKGIKYRDKKSINEGKKILHNSLDDLPIINRKLTRWEDYSVNNANYKYVPGAYTMAGRDCWWGRCTFCSWTTMYPGNKFRCMDPDKLLDEIGNLIKLGAKEVMDDSGSFPRGEYLEEFCKGMIKRGYHKKIRFDCNMRFNSVTERQFKLMRRAGFRFILFGFESASQETLDRVNKNNKVEYAERDLKWAKKAGLDPHITAMVGYPWESKKQAQKTLNMAKSFFRKGYLDSLQATIVIPYPGTPLYDECKKNNWLKTEDWNDYDMSMSVMKSPIPDDELKCMVKDMYKSAWNPGFIFRKVTSVRNIDDLKYLWRYGIKFLKKLKDF